MGEKKICGSMLYEKVAKIPKGEIVTSVIHMLVFVFSMGVILGFVGSVLDGSLIGNNEFSEILGEIFVNFVSQVYVIRFFGLHIKAK